MKFVYWTLGSFFFFVASGIVISLLKPGPTEIQVMNFMQGMMSAMHNSLMGASMENAETFIYMLQQSAAMSVITLLLGIVIGISLHYYKSRSLNK